MTDDQITPIPPFVPEPTPQEHLADGIMKKEAKDFEGAIADFTAALALAPDYVAALLERAECHGEIDRYDEAAADVDRALELAPENADCHFARAVVYFLRRDFKSAPEWANNALILDPDHAKALQLRAASHFGNGRYTDALADALRSAELDDTNEATYMTIGACFLQLGEGWRAMD